MQAGPSQLQTAVPQAGMLQRKCSCGKSSGPTGECAECRRRRSPDAQAAPRVTPGERPDEGNARQRIQLKPGPSLARPAGSRAVRMPGSGQALPEPTRSFFEERFGHSFQDVRIHADATAGQLALDLAARAFTHGHDIYFAPGEFRPDSQSGRKLLAHELTHVLQQRQGRLSTDGGSAQQAASYRQLEMESDRAAQSFVTSSSAIPVKRRARAGEVQNNTLEDLAELRDLAGQGLEAVAGHLMSYPEASSDPRIQALNELRGRLGGMTLVTLTPAQGAMLERVYADARDAAPFWLSIPDLDFSGEPVQRLAQVAPIAGGAAIAPWVIAALIVILIVIFLLQLIFYFEIPQRIAEGADTLVQEVQRALEETQPPTPGGEPEPEEKGPTDVFPPIGEDKPKPRDDDTCDILPISWPEELPNPYDALGGVVDLIRTSSSERDLLGLGPRGTAQRHLNEDIVAAREANETPPRPCFDDPDPYQFYDAHHIHPLFLAGLDTPENLCAVETRRHHLGHYRLQYQPEWIDIYTVCGETTDNLYRHTSGNYYYIADEK